MFTPTPTESIDELSQQYGLDELDRQILLEFIKLTVEEREAGQLAARAGAIARERFFTEKKQ